MKTVASVKPKDLPDPSGQIDRLIAEITDWRGEMFARVRKIIREADPAIVEEFKWMGSPVWSRDGIIAVGNAFKGRVNLTFAYGASLPDPDNLFNAGFEGNRETSYQNFRERYDRRTGFSNASPCRHRIQSDEIEEESEESFCGFCRKCAGTGSREQNNHSYKDESFYNESY